MSTIIKTIRERAEKSLAACEQFMSKELGNRRFVVGHGPDFLLQDVTATGEYTHTLNAVEADRFTRSQAQVLVRAIRATGGEAYIQSARAAVIEQIEAETTVLSYIMLQPA